MRQVIEYDSESKKIIWTREVLQGDKILYVCAKEGDDHTGDGSEDKPFATVEGAAVWIMSHIFSPTLHQVTLKLKPGTYPSFFLIDFPVRLEIEGMDEDGEVIFSDPKQKRLVAIMECLKGVFIRNVKFKDVDVSGVSPLANFYPWARHLGKFPASSFENFESVNTHLYIESSLVALEKCEFRAEASPVSMSINARYNTRLVIHNCVFATSNTCIINGFYYSYLDIRNCRLENGPIINSIVFVRSYSFCEVNGFTGAIGDNQETEYAKKNDRRIYTGLDYSRVEWDGSTKPVADRLPNIPTGAVGRISLTEF